MAAYAKYSAMAIQMGVLIAAGAIGGYFIDGLLDIRIPVFTVLLSLAAVAGAIWLMIKELSNNKE
ncbi:MAG: AtpZ/AtpI family protein [Bacteroidota bacterium]